MEGYVMKNVVAKVTFESLIVLGVMLAGQGNAELNLESTVGIWLFDERSGINVIDSSGKENHGTLADSAEMKRIRKGKFGRALEFDGKDDFVRVSHSDSLVFPHGISISVWVYPDGLQPWTKDGSAAQSGAIMEKKDNLGWSLFSWDGAGALTWHFSLAGVWSSQNGMIVPGILYEWQHIGCVYDGKEVNFYLNGELKASGPQKGGIQSYGDVLTIGRRIAGDHSAWFKGMIDDVAIFNTALTDEDIERLMNVGLGEALDVLAVSPSGKLAATWGILKTK